MSGHGASILSSAALSLCLALGPSAAAAHDASSSGAPVRVSIDTQRLGKESERTRLALLPEVQPVLQEAGFVVDEGAELELRIVVAYLDEGSTHDFLFRFDVAQDGEATEAAAFHCLGCVTNDLADRIVAELPATYPLLRVSETAEEGVVRPEEGPSPADPEPGRNDRTRAPLGPMGKSGIALLAVGTVGLGVGIGLVAVGERTVSGDQFERVNYRPGGFATLGVSAAMLVTGAVLLVVDRRRANKTTSLAPFTGPGLTGLSVSGRF